MTYGVNMVAEYVLAYCTDVAKPISNLQLQKFLYYIQGYTYKILSESAFHEDLYCWKYGPVSPDAYYQYCFYLRNPIAVRMQDIEENPICSDRELKRIVEMVSSKCLSLTAGRLVEKSHNEMPWKTAKPSAMIPKNEIKQYFRENDPLEIEE